MKNTPDDGHEHEFVSRSKRLTDRAKCALCGLPIMAGYELPVDWDTSEESPDFGESATPEPFRSTERLKGTP
jgi:hypothetical protein